MPQLPFVSVIIPARNEARFIGACLASLLQGDYPRDRWEILVVDGMSDDGTREVVAAVANTSPVPIRVVDNPRVIIPAALNRGVAQARGEVIIRADAHAAFPPGYVGRCVQALQASGAANVGGPVETRSGGEGTAAQAIALALSHPFGVGNSAFRTARVAQEADTVPFGCYHARIFREVGLFDERLHRNEDYEFNQRVRRAGGRIWMDPQLGSIYYSRGTLGGLLRQAWVNGLWNAASHYLHPACFCPRHALPGVFTLGVLFAAGMAGWALAGGMPGWVLPVAALAWLCVLLYLGLDGYVAVRLARHHGARYLLPLLVIFPAFHFTYGAGILWGWVRVLLRRYPWRPEDRTPTWEEVREDDMRAAA